MIRPVGRGRARRGFARNPRSNTGHWREQGRKGRRVRPAGHTGARAEPLQGDPRAVPAKLAKARVAPSYKFPARHLQYGHRTDPFDRRDGRDCSMRYCKHNITSTDVASAQGKLDRIRPACTADGVSNTNEIGKGGLEGLDLFTENIAAALQNASYGAVNRGLMR